MSRSKVEEEYCPECVEELVEAKEVVKLPKGNKYTKPIMKCPTCGYRITKTTE